MPEFRDAAKIADVPAGQVKQIVLDGSTQVCLANVDGVLYAIGGKCTHLGGPLGEGALEGTTVTCPWHGSKFDVTSGAVVGGPARTAEPSFEVRLSGSDVQVAVGGNA